MGVRVGVDIGGTFTISLPSTRTRAARTAQGLLHAPTSRAGGDGGPVPARPRFGMRPEEIGYFTHGTTVGINTVIQRKGHPARLFATRGFFDVWSWRGSRCPITIFFSRRPVRSSRASGSSDRGPIAPDGTIAEPLDAASVEAALAACPGRRAAEEVVDRLPPRLPQSRARGGGQGRSSPAPRRNPRLPLRARSGRSSANTNAPSRRPLAAMCSRACRLSHALAGGAGSAGVGADLKVTKSNGGVMGAERQANCVQMILLRHRLRRDRRQPLAKLCAAEGLHESRHRRDQRRHCVDLDGQPQYGMGEYIGEFRSLFRRSRSPRSAKAAARSPGSTSSACSRWDRRARARPGPGCYGTRRQRAHHHRRIRRDRLLGQRGARLQRGKGGCRCVARGVGTLARTAGLGRVETAAAIIEVSISGMYAGVSPSFRASASTRDFSLMPFGGAGPDARLFPRPRARHRGACWSRRRRRAERARRSDRGREERFRSHDVYLDLAPTAMADLRCMRKLRCTRPGGPRDRARRNGYTRVSADMRYRGPSFEIETPLTAAR